METVVLAVHLIVAFLLIGLVLLQRSEGGGLTSSGNGAISARSAATALSKLTWILAGLFIATSIALTVIAAQKAGRSSIADQVQTQAAETPAAPATDTGLTGTLTPPAASDAPAAPPAAPAPAAPATTSP